MLRPFYNDWRGLLGAQALDPSILGTGLEYVSRSNADSQELHRAY